jgi:hypothetical protein
VISIGVNKNGKGILKLSIFCHFLKTYSSFKPMSRPEPLGPELHRVADPAPDPST